MVHLVSWLLLVADTTKYVAAMATAKTGYENGELVFLSFIESTVVPWLRSVITVVFLEGEFKNITFWYLNDLY